MGGLCSVRRARASGGARTAPHEEIRTMTKTTSSARESSVHTGLSAACPVADGKMKVCEIVDNEVLEVIEFILDADQLIHEEEPSPMPTVVQVLEGTIRFSVDGVEQAATAYEEAAGSSADLIRVANLARGENEAGTPLATWVLQARFEEVLVFANERLSQMSSGRYELIRVAEETSQRRRRKGLGLAVVDHLGDERTRDPRTLSGGETFYVSLSLALALADVVSAESGGVSLETLFIDEGFGTLDADTLQMVMAEIDHLRAGGRTVGIVSHVAELRDQIAERIAVRRIASGGSTLKVTA